MKTNTPRVLLVTGAYYPEISAAGVQCRAVAAAIGDRAQLSVLTTAVDPRLPPDGIVDGRPVFRVVVDVTRAGSKALASVRLVRRMLWASGTYDMIHLHGFSQKNVPASILARLLGKPVVLTLHTAGQDEPEAVRRRGAIAFWAFSSATLTTAVSPDLVERWRAAGLRSDRVRLVPNGVDTKRFRPATADERRTLRRELGWPENERIVLFVGFFSRDKRPDLLFRAWQRVVPTGVHARLAFVGAKGAGYFEIDASLAREIAEDTAATGWPDGVMLIEPDADVDRYFRAADLFVLPSIREAHPLALLEAMACGLPCIATRLPGATDVIVTDRDNGRLFPPDDETALADAIRDVMSDAAKACAMGARARATVVERYDVERTATSWLAAYDDVLTARV